MLLVDDDAESREVYGEFLKMSDFEVLHAENGLLALRLALLRAPDVVVMDLEMPVMSGFEAIQRLRADRRTSAIPIVVLSGNMALDHARARQLGCELYLTKPCSATDLQRGVQSLVEPTASRTDTSTG
ncbi:MAG TPA: response regulator [Polyangiaceae bacterium]